MREEEDFEVLGAPLINWGWRCCWGRIELLLPLLLAGKGWGLLLVITGCGASLAAVACCWVCLEGIIEGGKGCATLCCCCCMECWLPFMDSMSACVEISRAEHSWALVSARPGSAGLPCCSSSQISAFTAFKNERRVGTCFPVVNHSPEAAARTRMEDRRIARGSKL